MGVDKFLRDPLALIPALASRGCFNFLPDKPYLELRYYGQMRKRLDLERPRTFNEKIQWLKLHDRNPLYTELVDKYEVRRHIADVLGGESLIPLVGGPWDSFEEIDFEALPDQFVLKCTHDSGGLVICRDKSKLDKAAAEEKINGSLARNYFYNCREWPYKNVKPRIIAEAYMEDGGGALGLTDYKFFCFNGKPKMLYVSEGLEDHATASISFYDLEGNSMPFRRSDYKPLDGALALPGNFPELLAAAEKLAGMVGSAFVRIDLYSILGKMYFSEVTFSPCGGMMPLEPEEWDLKLGQWLELPQEKTRK